VELQGLNERIGQDGESVVFALAISHNNLMVVKVNVFYAQAHTFHDTQSAVHDLGDEFIGSYEVGNETFDFVFGENRWYGFGASGTKFSELEFVEFDLENVTIEEEEGAKSLVPPAPTAGAVWVEADTSCLVARWVRNCPISGMPISLGWRLLWKRM
jgi:hypothetical protein